jgi:hypothetical protein
MRQAETIISKWSPLLLLMELDKLLWKEADHIEIRKLWQYLCSYCYLPRLSGFKCLEEAIREGVNSKEYFAYASGFAEGRYIGLKFDSPLGGAEISGLLLKREIALRQLESEARILGPEDSSQSPGPPKVSIPAPERAQIQGQSLSKAKTKFFMSAPLEFTRINRHVGTIVDEILAHLVQEAGDGNVKITLEVSAQSPKGFSKQLERDITENCQQLKIESSFD